MGNEPSKKKGFKSEGHQLGPPSKPKPSAPPPPKRQAAKKEAPPSPKQNRHYGGGMSMSQAAASSSRQPPQPTRVTNTTRSQPTPANAASSNMDRRFPVVQAGLAKMQAAATADRQKALEMMIKFINNVLKNPLEAKYQTIWLVNAKVAGCLNKVDGSVMVLEGAGFEPAADGNLVYNDNGDKSNNYLHRVHDAVQSALFEIVGRPTADGEVGGTATMGRWRGERVIGDDQELADRVAQRGGVCAPKFDAAVGVDEMTIEQSQQIQDAWNYIRGNNQSEVCQGLLKQVSSILEEIMRAPDDDSLRQLELPPAVMAIEGARNLAEAIGCEYIQLDGSEQVVCGLSVPVLRSVLDQLSQCQTALSQQQQAARADEERQQVLALPTPDRETAVMHFRSSSRQMETVPDSFFQLTSGDIAQLTSGSSSSRRVKNRKYVKCLVRVQLPEDLCLQAVFSPAEKVSALQLFVSEALAEPFRPFALSLGTRALDDMNRSLWDAGLVPSALLHFRWLPMEMEMGPCTQVLTSELMQQLIEVD